LPEAVKEKGNFCILKSFEVNSKPFGHQRTPSLVLLASQVKLDTLVS
jgi:hypothetical protein